MKTETEIRKQEINERISLLCQEIWDNEEQNRFIQDEIAKLDEELEALT